MHSQGYSFADTPNAGRSNLQSSPSAGPASQRKDAVRRITSTSSSGVLLQNARQSVQTSTPATRSTSVPRSRSRKDVSMLPDAWSQMQDLDGQQLYEKLEVQPNVTAIDLRKAYRKLAKRHHPDRGGTAAAFAQIQQAYAVLSDPGQRAVYDAWAKELQYRYLSHPEAARSGGESMLLNHLEQIGVHCDPRTQLVVTCEVCRRPATKECWVCTMKICEFCSMVRHWKGAFPLHWPLINSDHMRTKLAKRELEKKRIEDDQRLMLQDPNHRSDTELYSIRSFRKAAKQMLNDSRRQVTYNLQLAQYYMWAQTQQHVFLAVYLPTGYQDQQLHLECSGNRLLLQPQNSPPVIDRLLDYAVDTNQAVESFKTEDNRLVLLTLPKAQPDEQWMHMFRGDPDGARCMQALYNLTESDSDILMEIPVPFHIEASDVHVDIGTHKLQVCVRNTLSFSRTYWAPRYTIRFERLISGDKANTAVIDTEHSMWTIDAGSTHNDYNDNTLVISLALPAVTEEEHKWRKGQRKDHRSQHRPEGMQHKGVRYFIDDEDSFGLEDILQAAMFVHTGCTLVPPKPWQQGICNKHVSSQQLLSKEVRQHVTQMQHQAVCNEL